MYITIVQQMSQSWLEKLHDVKIKYIMGGNYVIFLNTFILLKYFVYGIVYLKKQEHYFFFAGKFHRKLNRSSTI